MCIPNIYSDYMAANEARGRPQPGKVPRKFGPSSCCVQWPRSSDSFSDPPSEPTHRNQPPRNQHHGTNTRILPRWSESGQWLSPRCQSVWRETPRGFGGSARQTARKCPSPSASPSRPQKSAREPRRSRTKRLNGGARTDGRDSGRSSVARYSGGFGFASWRQRPADWSGDVNKGWRHHFRFHAAVAPLQRRKGSLLQSY